MPKPKLTLLLSCVVGKDNINAENMGIEHYSYAVAMSAYKPYLSSFAEVIILENPASQVDYYYQKITENGGNCLHLAFGQPVGIYLSRKCPTINVVFWEFPDIPTEELKLPGIKRHNWIKIIRGLKGLVVHSRENLASFSKIAADLPIGLWKTPISEMYFGIEPWKEDQNFRIAAPDLMICKMGTGLKYKDETPTILHYIKFAIVQFKPAINYLWHTFVHTMGLLITSKIPKNVKRPIKNILKTLKKKITISETVIDAVSDAAETIETIETADSLYPLEISGIVYTTLLNSNDKRKNWKNLIKGFVWAFKDRNEVTLIIKLIDDKASEKKSLQKIENFIESLNMPNGPKIILLSGYLNNEYMKKLVSVTTYYINLSHAEGQCLPLNEYLAAGRPALCPCHSSMQDYVREEYCFIIDSFKSPTGWPENPDHLRTTWSEINIESYIQNLHHSYQIAVENYSRYLEMSHAASRAMKEYFDEDSLQRKITDFILDLLRDDNLTNITNIKVNSKMPLRPSIPSTFSFLNG